MLEKEDLPQSMPRARKASAIRRPGTVLVGIVLILVAVPLGIYLYQHRPNLYDSTRVELIEAERKLDVYHHDMELVVQEDQHGTEILKAFIELLKKAAALDPEDAAEINAISAGLQGWEQQVHAGTLSTTDLHDKYQLLSARMHRLINKRTEASRTNN